MSTQKNPPADERGPAVDETVPADVTAPVAEAEQVDETQLIALPDEATEVVEPDATTELPTTGPIDEAASADEGDNTAPIDETALLPVETPAPSDPLDVFAAPAIATPAMAAPAPRPAPQPARQPEPVRQPVVDAPVVVPTRRRLRVGTVVWGLIIAACGLGVIAWASGAQIDLQLALIVLLAVAGTALLVGSIVSGARNARR